MNPLALLAGAPSWLGLLTIALQAIPAEIGVVQQAIADHWGKDHVQQLVKGADYLGLVASTLVKAGVDANGVPPAPPAAAPAIDYNQLAAAILAQSKPAAASK